MTPVLIALALYAVLLVWVAWLVRRDNDRRESEAWAEWEAAVGGSRTRHPSHGDYHRQESE